MNILGISCFYHDSAACLVRDGEIIAAVQEERFTRKKHDFNFPINSINWCLREGGIVPSELDYIVFYDKPLIKFSGGNFSLGQYFAGLQQMPYGNRPRFTTAEQLSNQLGNWVRDELLLREAKRRNLEREPRVQADVHSIMEQQFYNLLVEQEIAALAVPDSVSAYFKSPVKQRSGKNLALSRFQQLEEWRRVEAEKNVHNQLGQGKRQVWIDRDKIRQESRGINWDRRIRMFMVRQ